MLNFIQDEENSWYCRGWYNDETYSVYTIQQIEKEFYVYVNGIWNGMRSPTLTFAQGLANSYHDFLTHTVNGKRKLTEVYGLSNIAGD